MPQIFSFVAHRGAAVVTKVWQVKHTQRYPWEQWFATPTKKFKLQKGRDYFCKTLGMVGQIRNWVRNRYRVSIDVAEDEKSLTVYILASLPPDHPVGRPDKTIRKKR